MSKQKETKTILVTGDVTIDWNVARAQKVDVTNANIWDADVFSKAFCQVGGANLIADLIAEVAVNLKKFKNLQYEINRNIIPPDKVKPDNINLNHAYAIWAPFDYDNSESGKKRKVWRVREYLGVSRVKVGAVNDSLRLNQDTKYTKPVIIVLDDAGLGFRDNEELWPVSLFRLPDTNIVMKIASPVTNSKLLDYLLDNCPQKLTVIMTADDLRRSHTEISKGISWERTAQDLLSEFMNNPVLNRLSHCANIIISFHASGAVLLSAKNRKIDKVKASLLFDPNSIEDRWGQEYKGGVIGNTSCLTAAVVRELMQDAHEPDISFAIQSGVNAMRLLKTDGFGDVDTKDISKTSLAFPVAKVAAGLEKVVSPLAVVQLTIPDEKARSSPALWTILEDRYLDDMEKVAKDIVWKGLDKVISGVPVYRSGKLTSIDRREIEALNNIYNLISEYFRGNQSKPVSIAVFGPPGSGKSFAITQMAESIAKEQLKPITFNISQFTDVKDLIDAFHQVRDISLSGKLPLVFWDEFDTNFEGMELGWLRYFLAPMQDGTFQDGQIIHPIGRSVFVFAGSTSTTMEEFIGLDKKKYKNAKHIDFISRLKGFLNVMGINPVGNQTDRCHTIRRAIALRSILERSANPIISSVGRDNRANIDESVINAFLLTSEFKHGIRSMESIVAMSQLANKTSFEKSYLPDEKQLAMHVDAKNFVGILQQLILDPIIIEKMAPDMHEIYCQTLKREGYTYGEHSSDAAMTNENLLPFDKLSDNVKEQNCELVRDIPHKLSLTAYVLLTVSSKKRCCKFTNKEIEFLAKNEHDRWMREKLAKGFTYGQDRDRMQNPFLLEWSQLTEPIKERDRAFVRGIPKILTKYGYIMAPKKKP